MGALESIARTCTSARPKRFCPHRDVGLAPEGLQARGPMPHRISYGLASARWRVSTVKRVSSISGFGRTFYESLSEIDIVPSYKPNLMIEVADMAPEMFLVSRVVGGLCGGHRRNTVEQASLEANIYILAQL